MRQCARSGSEPARGLQTIFLLLAQYDGLTVIPLDIVCRDIFSHLSLLKFARHLNEGNIRLPAMRMDASAKTANRSPLGSKLTKRRRFSFVIAFQ